MRNKIILVNAVIVAIVGVLSFVIVRGQLLGVVANTAHLMDRAKFDAQGAAGRFQLDGLRAEQWIAAKASEPSVLDVFAKSDPGARNQAATSVCDVIQSQSKTAHAFEGAAPSLVLMVDATGHVVGRSGSTQGRGEDLGALYPSLKEALDKQRSGTDVWVNSERGLQVLASFAPILDKADKGELRGALVVGVALNDALTEVSDTTTGGPLVLVAAQKGGDVSVVAHSSRSDETISNTVVSDAFKADLQQTIHSAHTTALQANNLIFAAAALDGLGDGKHAAIVAATPAALIENAGSLPLSIFGVTALGIVLVILGGWLLGNYMSRPINQLEEGLLAILNGQHDKRFELEHAELGGLAFRIDQLLNQLMGVEEDTTDAEGRVSSAPRVQNFADAMGVEDKRGDGGVDPAAVAQLASEPEGQYYARLYREYIQAKQALGEDTSHITEQTFTSRIQNMEKDATGKHGRPVRYKVLAQNREVTLLAIPLG